MQRNRDLAGSMAVTLLFDVDIPGGAGGSGSLSARLGNLIGWGEGKTAEAVAQTEAVTEGLTPEQIQEWAKQGLTKEWVIKQLAAYTKSVVMGADKLKNINLLPRKALMEKILELWK